MEVKYLDKVYTLSDDKMIQAARDVEKDVYLKLDVYVIDLIIQLEAKAGVIPMRLRPQIIKWFQRSCREFFERYFGETPYYPNDGKIIES